MHREMKTAKVITHPAAIVAFSIIFGKLVPPPIGVTDILLLSKCLKNLLIMPGGVIKTEKTRRNTKDREG
jgi:hypothetical protein